MVVRCRKCKRFFEDVYRSTICPHGTFAANDGQNNFAHHPESYLSAEWPMRLEDIPFGLEVSDPPRNAYWRRVLRFWWWKLRGYHRGTKQEGQWLPSVQ
jgi:hypothetical protein